MKYLQKITNIIKNTQIYSGNHKYLQEITFLFFAWQPHASWLSSLSSKRSDSGGSRSRTFWRKPLCVSFVFSQKYPGSKHFADKRFDYLGEQLLEHLQLTSPHWTLHWAFHYSNPLIALMRGESIFLSSIINTGQKID